MRHTRTEETPASRRTVLDRVTYDICGAEIPEQLTSAETVVVKCRTETSYYGSGDGSEIGVDLCPQCFREKLLPWLREQGARPPGGEMELVKPAEELSKLTGVEVMDHPYDCGYWSRIAGLPRPAEAQAKCGWDQADGELADEEQS